MIKIKFDKNSKLDLENVKKILLALGSKPEKLDKIDEYAQSFNHVLKPEAELKSEVSDKVKKA